MTFPLCSSHGACVVFHVDRAPGLVSGRGGRGALHPPWLRGPAQPGKIPSLYSLYPPAGLIPLGVGLGGETRPWMKSSGNHRQGPNIPKTGRGWWGHCRPPQPQPPPVSGKAAFQPLTSIHSRGGSGAHLISPDHPGMVPALSPCSLMGRATGSAWKNPIRPVCLQGVEGVRGAGLG